VQTFAPYGRDIARGFAVLDYRRLGKQRVETYQILRTLLYESKGWRQHPATKMWMGHAAALAEYGRVNCVEWIDRGYQDNLLPIFEHTVMSHRGSKKMPKFLDEIAVSHQSNLIRKYPEYYTKFWPNTPDDLEYVWPENKESFHL